MTDWEPTQDLVERAAVLMDCDRRMAYRHLICAEELLSQLPAEERQQRARKGHERLENCICWWETEPYEEQVEREDISPHTTTVWYEMTLVRTIKHTLNRNCVVHSWALSSAMWGKPVPKVSNIAVEAVPLANRPSAKVVGGEKIAALVQQLRIALAAESTITIPSPEEHGGDEWVMWWADGKWKSAKLFPPMREPARQEYMGEWPEVGPLGG